MTQTLVAALMWALVASLLIVRRKRADRSITYAAIAIAIDAVRPPRASPYRRIRPSPRSRGRRRPFRRHEAGVRRRAEDRPLRRHGPRCASPLLGVEGDVSPRPSAERAAAATASSTL